MISDEAFNAAEAAYRETLTDLRLSEGGGFKVSSQVKRSIHAALEAVAPHLMAQAWDEGSVAGWRESGLAHSWNAEHSLRKSNPYRSQDDPR